MKLDELMAGLDEFLNAPPTKRKKVSHYFQTLGLFYIKVDIIFNDEPESEEESPDNDDSDLSDSDATDASDEYVSDSSESD